ncbi:MAG TPA: type VI secretion system protein TssA [Pirellulales bacterium]|jgi:type VI secretion system protein ImpA|nr:type VI secretion system protein TssA [Pirellulales bacterium]
MPILGRFGETLFFESSEGCDRSRGSSVEAVSDIIALLNPIDGDNPCGDDLRFSPVFDQIRIARPQADRQIFDTGEETETNNDWTEVVELASNSLATQSKDLRIAGWFVEGLVHQHGFAGLRDGIRLLNGLLETFWDTLHPRLDDQEPDLEVRVAPLVYLTSIDSGALLPNYLRDAPLTPPNSEGRGYSLNFYNARQVRGAPSPDETVNAERHADAAAKAEKFDNAVAVAPLAFFIEMRQTIADAQAELHAFDQLLDTKFGREAPSVVSYRQVLEEASQLVSRLIRDKGGDAPEGEVTSEGGETSQTSAQPQGSKGPITSREDALRRLSEVAAYLRRAEPQSPIPYLLDRAVVWARKPLHILLPELTQIFQILSQTESETDSTGG